MANIIDLITLGEKSIIVADADPSVSPGLAAEIGSLAVVNDGGVGRLYLKTGAANTAWDLVDSSASGVVNPGDERKLALYPANGSTVDDTLLQNSQPIDIIVEAQPTRTAPIEYTIPNPGDAITAADFVLTEGVQTINGDKTFGDDVVIQGDLTVNGTTTTVNTVNLLVTDKLITLNDNGAADSGNSTGIEIEENGIATGYFKTEAAAPITDAWLLKAPDSFEATLDLSLMTADRNYAFPDQSGTLFILPSLTAGSVLFSDGTTIAEDNANFFWDDTNNRLGLGNNNPSVTLDVSGDLRLRAQGDLRFADADSSNYVGFQAPASITADVLWTLPSVDGSADYALVTDGAGTLSWKKASGKVNDGLERRLALYPADGNEVDDVLSQNSQAIDVRIVAQPTRSAAITYNVPNPGDAIASADFVLTEGAQTINGAKTFTTGVIMNENGDAVDTRIEGDTDQNLVFVDASDDSVGIGTNAPARKLDVNGDMIVRDDFRIENAGGVNFEIKQGAVNTTDATLTTAQSIPVPADSMVLIEARILGRKTSGAGVGATGDGAAYVRTARFKNIGGTVTIHNLQSDFTSEDQAGWNGLLAVVGTNAVVRVQGSANNNMTWEVTTKIQILD